MRSRWRCFFVLGFFLYFIRSSATITNSRCLKFPFWYDINNMNIIVKESFLSGILNAHNQTKKVFTTKLSRFSYLFMLLFLGGDVEICQRPQNTLSDFCNSRGFKIVHQNVRGILTNHHLESFVNKKGSKLIWFAYLKLVDICDNNSLYFLPSYVFLHRNRHVDTGGGVARSLKHEIKFKRRYDVENHLKLMD